MLNCACMTVGPDERFIIVLVSRDPDKGYINAHASVYVAGNLKHAGFIKEGKVQPEKETPPLTEQENVMVMRAYQALTVALINVHECQVP